MNILMITVLIISVFLTTFFFFKARQVIGKIRDNEIMISYGEGSYFKGIYYKIMQVIYILLTFFTIPLTFYIFTLYYDTPNKNLEHNFTHSTPSHISK